MTKLGRLLVLTPSDIPLELMPSYRNWLGDILVQQQVPLNKDCFQVSAEHFLVAEVVLFIDEDANYAYLIKNRYNHKVGRIPMDDKL